jgi:5-methyltetrahydrofolate--homocysteine methyltransferase
VWADDKRRRELATLRMLRQQQDRSKGSKDRANYCLADLVAPQGVPDWVGGFAVTTGEEVHGLAEAFKKAGNDYDAIMVQSLADRLAEAFAEYMHARVRRELWGYAPDETLSGADLIDEKYRGIRPAPGYPACPDHTEKQVLFDMLDAENHTGIRLTESFAMWPASSVSGLYFSHPDSAFFGIGRIGRDQVEDYARRKNMPVAEMEKWLAPNLAYEPARGPEPEPEVEPEAPLELRRSA